MGASAGHCTALEDDVTNGIMMTSSVTIASTHNLVVKAAKSLIDNCSTECASEAMTLLQIQNSMHSAVDKLNSNNAHCRTSGDVPYC